MSQGKGSERRPMVIDDRQLSFNWNKTFPSLDDVNREMVSYMPCNCDDHVRSQDQDQEKGLEDKSEGPDFIVSTKQTRGATRIDIDGFGGYLRYS
jgi:hypothetical protein